MHYTTRQSCLTRSVFLFFFYSFNFPSRSIFVTLLVPTNIYIYHFRVHSPFASKMLVFFFCAQKTKILLFIHLIMSSSAGMRLWYIVRIVLYNCIHTNLQIPPYVRSVLMRFRITHPLHSATKHIRRHRRRCCVHGCEYYSQYCDAVHEREYGTKTYRNIFLSYFNNFFLYMCSLVFSSVLLHISVNVYSNSVVSW